MKGDFRMWSHLLNPQEFGLPSWVETVRPLSHLKSRCVTFVNSGVRFPDVAGLSKLAVFVPERNFAFAADTFPPGFFVKPVQRPDYEVLQILANGKFEPPHHGYTKDGACPSLHSLPFKTLQLGAVKALWPSRGGCWVGKGVTVGAHVAVDPGVFGEHTEIGHYTQIDNLVHVGHSSRIGQRCTLVAGTVLGGWTVLEDDVWMGINSSTLPHVRVGRGAYVGAGAVCTRDVPAFACVAGVPAKRLYWRCPCGRRIEFEGTIASCACRRKFGLAEGGEACRELP